MPRRRKLLPSSRRTYDAALLRAFGTADPDFVPRPVIEAWPESTRETLRYALKDYWRRKGEPERGVRLAERIEPGERTERVRLVPAEPAAKRFEAAVKELKARPRTVILLMLGLGLRVEEMLTTERQQWKDALKLGRVEVLGKGKKVRQLPTLKAATAIRTMLELPGLPPHATMERTDAEYPWAVPGQLLAGPDSTFPTQRNMLDRHIKTAAIAAGLATESASNGWAPHMLRHIFATRMSAAGAPYPVLKAALGHSRGHDVSLTYVSVSLDDISKYMRVVRA